MFSKEGILQRPLRSHRQNKTSQGTRARDRKPLQAHQNYGNMADYSDNNFSRPASGGEPLNLVVQSIKDRSGDVLASSDIYRGDQVAKLPTAAKFIRPPRTATGERHTQVYAPYQKTLGHMLSDVVSNQRKGLRQRRKLSTQHQAQKGRLPKVTYFQHHPQIVGETIRSGSTKLSREGSNSNLKRSVISNKSCSSSKSKTQSQRGSVMKVPDSPGSTKSQRKRVSMRRRAREQEAISSENMRFVSKLVNIKPTVPNTYQIAQRVSQQKKLRKNLARSFQGGLREQGYANLPISMASNQNGSHMGTPMSDKSSKPRKATSSPRVDLRLKSKPVQNHYRIRSNSPQRSPQSEQHCQTPTYLKRKNFDPRAVAQLYEIDDVMIFGDNFKSQKTKKRKRGRGGVSDTASRASSRGGENSARRYKKHKASKGMYGETGSDHSFQKENFNMNNVSKAISCAKHSANFQKVVEHPQEHQPQQYPSTNGLILQTSSMASQLVTQPIAESVPRLGTKPNPVGQSLIQKMNHLMHSAASYPTMQQRLQDQKTLLAERAKINAVTNYHKQPDQMSATADVKSNATAPRYQNQPYDIQVMAAHQAQHQSQPRKSFIKRLSKSIPRVTYKRKSQQEAFSLHPLNVHNPRTALISGYYSSSTAHRLGPKIRNNASSKVSHSSNAHPRMIKTATVRHKGQSEIEQQRQYATNVDLAQKTSPNSKGSLTRSQNQARSTKFNSSATQGTIGKRRIIVAVNKQLEHAQNQNEAVWRRPKRTISSIEDPTQQQSQTTKSGKGRPPMPQSAQQNIKQTEVKGPQFKKGNQQQNDFRQRTLAEKLFSPILGGQGGSSKAVASTNEPSTELTADNHASEILVTDNIMQGQLRPRQTRTAEGQRARQTVSKAQTTTNEDLTDENNILAWGAQSSGTGSVESKPIAVTQWLVQNSSAGGSEEKLTAKSQSVAQIEPEAQNSSSREVSQQSFPVFGKIIGTSFTQLNLEQKSQNTLQQVCLEQHINEDSNGAPSRQSQETNQCRQSKAAGFKAPEKFNQISEGGSQSETSHGPKNMDAEFNIDLEAVGAASGGNSDDESATDVDQQQLEGQRGLIEEIPEHEALPKSYPRLL